MLCGSIVPTRDGMGPDIGKSGEGSSRTHPVVREVVVYCPSEPGSERILMDSRTGMMKILPSPG